MDYELCENCLEHVILEAKHEWCNQLCRPPFHRGGGTFANTPECQETLMEASLHKHYNIDCCEKSCPSGHGKMK